MAVALAAAVVAWWVLPRGSGVSGVSPDERVAIRAKGADRLVAFVRRGERVWRAAPGEQVRAGDQVQFAYSCARACHVLLAGRDATGVTVVYLGEPDRLVALPPGEDAPLPTALELDDAPGDVFYGVFCAAPTSLGAAIETLRVAGELGTLPEECGVDRLALDKVGGP